MRSPRNHPISSRHGEQTFLTRVLAENSVAKSNPMRRALAAVAILALLGVGDEQVTLAEAARKLEQGG